MGTDKVEVEQIEDAGFLLLSGLVVAEVKLVNGEFIGEFRLSPSQGDGVLKALLELDVGESTQRTQEVEILRGGGLDDGVKLIGHGFEA